MGVIKFRSYCCLSIEKNYLSNILKLLYFDIFCNYFFELKKIIKRLFKAIYTLSLSLLENLENTWILVKYMLFHFNFISCRINNMMKLCFYLNKIFFHN